MPQMNNLEKDTDLSSIQFLEILQSHHQKYKIPTEFQCWRTFVLGEEKKAFYAITNNTVVLETGLKL